MDALMNSKIAENIQGFRLPRYAQLPEIGLYLEQTASYVNQLLRPLGCVEITGSMIRNYVKMGLVGNPVQKQYGADQLAHIIAVALLKNVMTLEHIGEMFRHQRLVYTDQVAYDYFCTELENVLYFRFGLKADVDDVGVTSSAEKEMLRSAVVAVSYIIHLHACFAQITGEE